MTTSGHFVRLIIRGGSTRKGLFSRAELDTYADVLRDPARARASSRCYRTFLTGEMRRLARGRYAPDQLEVPTLLLMGADSILQRGFAPEPSRNLTVSTVAGAGHFLPEEAPHEVFTQADAFLGGRGWPTPASGT